MRYIVLGLITIYMRKLTKIISLQAVLVLAAVFFFAAFAQASQSHHSHHSAKIVSPFEKRASADKPLHCLLNAHLHKSNEDCPHTSNHSKHGKSTELRADCGSNPVNSDGISFGNDLPQYTQSDEIIHHLVFQFLFPLTAEKARLFPHSIERPPQLS